MVFKYALDMELVDSNPVQRVRLPKKVVTYENMEQIEDKFLVAKRIKKAFKSYEKL